MKFKLCMIVALGLVLNVSAYANIKKSNNLMDFKKEPVLSALNDTYKKELNHKDLFALKERTLKLAGKSVPVLVNVMKSSEYPDKNRWIATFLLGRIVGKQAAPFIAKFSKHPSWVLRMASLKTLLALKLSDYGPVYADALGDSSLLVRIQALENIKSLKLKPYGSRVWAMLYDQQNYYNVKNVYKRTNIIKNVIKTVGDLKLLEAKKPLFVMINDKKYEDIFEEMDYSLGQLTGKSSPKGEKVNKRQFWKRMSLAETKI
ncbi:MAG: hypothetical protein A2202_04640 [Bdellovibrionales bacterium RIFOXYA1_FULL_36_14]|nr:MAG: hypothetical protein A2202_04640 [Bdellovibrionales bacterium RIFOXYA1_FULL_36_14]